MKTRLRKLHNNKSFNLNELINQNKQMMEQDKELIKEIEKRLEEKHIKSP
ncbi:FbpB family small basic protein [Bacillus sp. FJAT-49736]|nr:FbpB family small basic protein [Bacillus sp. FJAT-49736]MBS4174509.1 FbpB family small basic protein [Bacillus sp. FJAT-49736]